MWDNARRSCSICGVVVDNVRIQDGGGSCGIALCAETALGGLTDAKLGKLEPES